MFAIILALLGCYLPDKQKQAAQVFFDENSPQSSDMGSNEIVTEGVFVNLKLYVAEHRLLIDIKETLHTLHNLKNDNQKIPPLTDYNEEYFNRFFLEPGSERSKELIKLLGRVKNKGGDFEYESEVHRLYFHIRELYSPDIKYPPEDGHDYIVDMSSRRRPAIDQQYLKVKEGIRTVGLK
ncbi:P52 family lipoprotein [Borreliella bavariensis]|uniref:P52 family lipoprotein n=1 Tax=Borreliella bavariensis TaxID=664662 RepID=UPI001F2DF927|nr:P52 family lipoprotein [Borreliella bavariensis]